MNSDARTATDALKEIWRIAHIPTPRGTSAYTHFQRDFDKIRELCRPHIGTVTSGEVTKSEAVS